ncbi:alpha/beta hydrolase [Pseudoalteromonas sp. JBTF-M23]|uniref:Alpha/beta hydrolase n=1 Tax=Pseudoalteromonas caenipelagi TaxID=2726988 RepID=A0A849VLW1_9GAMM|nr:alpha/beta hydrolase [Pseudoalteromonas caenipelagi]NOU52661.1 alpha/beta hydrolase [Pseudoalteromonas caenipelagi]
MLRLLPSVVLAVCLTACGGSKVAHDNNDSSAQTGQGGVIQPSENTKIVSRDGRHYRIAFPESGFNEKKAYKLLLAFHGSGGSALSMQNMARFEKLSDDYIVVYPKSKEVEWDDGCLCNVAHRLDAKDVEFVVDIVNEMHTEYNLLEGENYAVGFSQGGLFSQNMMCKHSELFKGVASVASPMSEQLSLMCNIAEPTNYMMVMGQQDKTLPYGGLKHSNFGLISAPSAIDYIAKQNLIDGEYAEKALVHNVIERVYRNELPITNKLITILGGTHTWTFKNFNTSREVLTFFDNSSDIQLPEHSALYRLDTGDYHVRTMGQSNGKSDIVVLSGANKFFHSDSAWTALIQPMLAEHGKVHVVDRLNNAWSSEVEEPSFASFAQDLPKLLEALKVESVIFIAFANSNLATLMYQNLPNESVTTKGMIWVDPDILLPHSIAQYQSGYVSYMREYKQEFIEHVSEGPWTERTVERVALEREEIEGLISPNNMPMMDWDYYDAVTTQRAEISKQITRIKEMMNYYDDLEASRYLANNLTVPVSIIDSDFERLDIASAEEEETKQGLIKWQTEGTQWSKDITQQTQGDYFALENASHQVLFEHPETVIEALTKMLARE